MAWNIIYRPWGGTKVLGYWLNYYFILFDCFSLFLHFLTSLVKFVLCLKFIYGQETGNRHGGAGEGGVCPRKSSLESFSISFTWDSKSAPVNIQEKRQLTGKMSNEMDKEYTEEEIYSQKSQHHRPAGKRKLKQPYVIFSMQLTSKTQQVPYLPVWKRIQRTR